jgi:hypothetical protein
MQSWMARLGLVITMLAMVLAVSMPAVAQEEELELDDLDDLGDELTVEADIGSCDLVSTGDDDLDGDTDEDELNSINEDPLNDDLEGEDGLVLVCDVSLDVDDDADEDEDEEDEDEDE